MIRNGSDVIGFVIGFLFGCCGLLYAAFLRTDYVRGVLVGISVRLLLGVVLGMVANAPGAIERVNPGGADWTRDVPWELVAAFGIATVFVVGLIAGAIWAFGGRGGDDDDDGPPPPVDRDYVTFTR